jgi:peptidoglycan/LPS O-acetylase OafA/YrhL
VDWAGDSRLPLAVAALVFATLGFAGLTRGEGLTGIVLRLPLIQYLGKISYSFYLWHPLIMALVKHFLLAIRIGEHAGPWSQVVFFCLALPPSLVAAAVSQEHLERRTGAWLHAQLRRRPSLIGLASPGQGQAGAASRAEPLGTETYSGPWRAAD